MRSYGKEPMVPVDGIQKHIAELSDKDLVLMVTLDRKEYLEDVPKIADGEIKRRNIQKTTVDKYLRLLGQKWILTWEFRVK
jgi:hypothetical protein